jgi:hypothetical protein
MIKKFFNFLKTYFFYIFYVTFTMPQVFQAKWFKVYSLSIFNFSPVLTLFILFRLLSRYIPGIFNFSFEKSYFLEPNLFRNIFISKFQINKFFYFSIFFFIQKENPFVFRFFTLLLNFLLVSISAFFLMIKSSIIIFLFFFEVVAFFVLFFFTKYFFRIKTFFFFFIFKLKRKLCEIFIFFFIRIFTIFFSFFFFKTLSSFKSNYATYIAKLKLFLTYYYSMMNLRFSNPKYFKKLIKRLQRKTFRKTKPILDYKLRKQIFAEEAFIEAFDLNPEQPVINFVKIQSKMVLNKPFSKNPLFLPIRFFILIPAIFVTSYLQKFFVFYRSFKVQFRIFISDKTFSKFYTTFYINFFLNEIRFFYYIKNYLSIFQFFGIYFSESQKLSQTNYFKLFLSTFSLNSSHAFFSYFKSKNIFLKNDLMFYVFSQPYVFNFFFPVFSNIFIDALIQEAIVYRDDAFYKTYSTYLSNVYYKSRSANNSEQRPDLPDFDEPYEAIDDEDQDEDENGFDNEFLDGRLSYHSEFINSDIEEDFESEEQTLVQPFIKYVAKHHSKNIKRMFSLYSEPTFSDYLDLYESFNSEYNGEFVGYSDSIEYISYLAHSDLGYYRESDLHEFFYQYYFSRFYGSSQIDIFFYSFVFPYAFKNFSFSHHLSKFFKSFFFDSVNYTFNYYLSFFYVTPFFSFLKLYFKISFFSSETKKLTALPLSKFLFFKQFHISRFVFAIKNLFYGYFYFLKTTSIQRDLDFQTTYNRLYDLKQNTQIPEVGQVDPSYDLTTTEDEDEDPDYLNHYFFENFEGDYETLFFEDDDFFHEDTENEQFYHNYVFSDDFIEPFLSDDEFQESIEYSMSIDDTFYNSQSYALNEQFEFELNEISLSEMLAQNAYINILNNFFVDILFSNNKYFNHIDPILDVDFALDFESEEIKSGYYESFANPPNLEQDDAFSLPNDKKSLIVIKNLAELYNDRLTKWVVKNKNFNLKPLPPFLFGIGRYIPSSGSNGFLKLSDLHSAFSQTKKSNLDFVSLLASSSKFKPYYDTRKFDKDFLKNFFLFFNSPVHLFPKDSYLSTVIAFHLLTKSFSFNSFEFLPKEIQLQSSLFLFDGMVAQLVYSEEINFSAVFETSSHFVPDEDFETQIFLHLRTLRPTTLMYLREKYISILELTSDSDNNFIGDSEGYHAQWGFFPSYTSSPTNFFFYHLQKIAPRLLHKSESDLPNFSSRIFPFFKRYKIKEDKFPNTKWSKKFYKEPNLKDYPKFRLPFLKFKYKPLDNYRIKRKARYLSKWYKFFKLEISDVYPESFGPKAVSFFSFIYFIDYSLFFALNHLRDHFFFLYSLLQTSISKQYRINPLIYQSYRLRPNSVKNTYFLFDTYYSNYLLHLDKKVKARQIRQLRANPVILKKFGFDPEVTYQTIADKKFKLSQRRKQLRKKNRSKMQKSFRYNYYFNVTGSEDLDDAIQHANVSLVYEKRNYWSSRLKLDNSDSTYIFNHQNYSPHDLNNAQFFDLSTIDFFYANEDNPFASFFFKFNSFSIFKSFDFYLQPYQYTFPIGNYYFDSFFYPEEETNTDFNIFDFYMIEEADELAETGIEHGEFEEYLPLELKDLGYDYKLNYETKFPTDETIDGTSDIQTSEYQIENDDDYLILTSEDERGYEQDDDEASIAIDFLGISDLPETDPNNDYHFDVMSSNIDYDEDGDIITFVEDSDAEGVFDREDRTLYDQLYDDNYQNVDFSELDYEEEEGLNYLQESFMFDRRFIDPFLANYFNKYNINPKTAYPASTFIHFRSRPLPNNKNEKVKLLLNRKLYILRNIKKPEDRKRFTLALKFPKKTRKLIKFRNTKYYLRYLHFSTLLNSNKPFYTPSFPFYNSFDVDFQLTSSIDDKFDIDIPLEQSETYDAELVDHLDVQLKEDFLTYLDQDNDDLDPDFFDFSSYTSVPISRFFFGYTKSNISPFTSSDPRFIISSGSEFKFINTSAFNSPFSETTTNLTRTNTGSQTPFSAFKQFSPFYFFFRLFFSTFIKYYLTLKIFWFYHFFYNKPEFQLITNFEIIFNHYVSHKPNYDVNFFKQYYEFISEWNKQLTKTSISLIKFDYFKNFFNPTYYSAKDSNFSNIFASKFAGDEDSEYLNLNFFVETELYTTLLINEKIEKVLSDRIQIPVFFWNYDEYFLYLINSFDEYEYNIRFDIQDSQLNQSQQNINTTFSDDPIERSDIYEEIFDNTKQLYISRVEIFFEAFGQLLFIGFFGFYNLVKNFFIFIKINYLAFTLYTETTWLSLYLHHGIIVYFVRIFLSFNLFVVIILYVFFNLPYLIFYFYPFVNTFSYVVINSIILFLAFFSLAFVIFKNFRFFLSSLDYDERISIFLFSLFLWFYNVYLGYVFNPSLSSRFVFDDLYNSPSEIRYLLLSRRNHQSRYRRPAFPFQNENYPFPAFRPSSYTQTPYNIIFSPSYELSKHPYAFGLPPEPNQTFLNFSKNFFFNSINSLREFPFIRSSSYNNILSFKPKRPTSTFISSSSNPIIDSFFRNRNRKLKRYRLFAVTVLPYEKHSFWSADLIRPNRINSETFGYPTQGFFNPLYLFTDAFSYEFSDVSSKLNSDYIYYPRTRTRRILKTSRFVRKFYRKFKFTSSRRSILTRFVPNLHDDPLFRKVLLKPHSYKPFKYKLVPNYERKKYLRNILLFYSRNARQGIKKIFKKEFQFDPRYKGRKRRAKGALRHKIFLSRLDNRRNVQQFIKPYAFFLSDNDSQRQKFISNYDPFTTNLNLKNAKSMFFISKNFTKQVVQPVSPSSNVNSKISKFVRSKNLNVNSSIDQKISSSNDIFSVNTESLTNPNFFNSLNNDEMLRLSNARFSFQASLPHMLYYANLERMGSTLYSKQYVYELSKRFNSKHPAFQKLFNFYKFKLFPNHYKFQIFFSSTYSEGYRFFFSSNYASRNTFLLSTLFSSSPIAETALKRIQYKIRLNVFTHLFKQRFNRLYLKGATKHFNSETFPKLLVDPIVSVLQPSTYNVPGSTFLAPKLSQQMENRTYFGVSNNVLTYTKHLTFDPHFHKFDHPFSIYFSSFGQDWYELFRVKTGFNFFSANSKKDKFGFYPLRIDSQFYNPITLNLFSSIVHNDSKNVINFDKRVRDLVTFRYAFNKFLNNRQKFVSSFSSKTILPLYSSSNYLSSILFSLYFFNPFYTQIKTNHPVFEPNFFSSFNYPSPIVTNDLFNPFLSIFSSSEMQKNFFLPSTYNSHQFDSVFDRSSFYDFGTRSFLQFQNRLTAARYPVNFTKIFNKKVQVPFRFLQTKLIEGSFAKPLLEVTRNRRVRKLFRSGRFKNAKLFSNKYHEGLRNRRQLILQKRKLNPRYRFSVSERKFLQNKLNRINSLKSASGFLSSERDFFYHSLLSFKPLPFYFFQESSLSFGKNHRSSNPITFSSFPFDIFSDVYFFNEISHSLYPKRVRTRFDKHYENPSVKIRRLGKRPSKRINSFFKRNQISHNRPISGYRDRFFLSKYFRN